MESGILRLRLRVQAHEARTRMSRVVRRLCSRAQAWAAQHQKKMVEPYKDIILT